jgi:hypothetical protein
MLPTHFKNATKLAEKADAYFVFIAGEYHLETINGKEQKICDRDPEPATMAGLALFLGFSSKQEFDDYEQNGEFAAIVKRSRLRIEAAYERKLHQQSPSGAIFALRALGWKEKTEEKTAVSLPGNIKIEIIESGPKPARTEQGVQL